MDIGEALKLVGSTAGGLSPVTAGLSLLQGGIGLAQMIGAGGRMKNARARLTAYETPDEYYDILNMTKNLASQGFDAFTLNYLTSNIDQAAAGSTAAVMRMGGDPNSVGDIFDRQVQSLFRVGQENQALNMEHFGKYASALEMVGDSETAEWKSRQDMIKDEIQSAAADKQAGMQNMFGGLNTFANNITNKQIADIYGKNNTTPATVAAIPKVSNFVATPAGSPNEVPNTLDPKLADLLKYLRPRG